MFCAWALRVSVVAARRLRTSTAQRERLGVWPIPLTSAPAVCDFRAELDRAVAERQQWLVAEDLARFGTDGGFEMRTSAFACLRERELQRVGKEAAARLQVPYRPVAPGQPVQGRVRDVIDAPGGKIVVIERRDGVSVVPWSRRLDNLRGREVAGTMGAHELMIGRMRGRTPLQR